jgi:hypothetical protein
MAISIVNGFLCFSSCDAAKAASGHNPHPRTDATTDYFQKATNAARPEEPAVVLGGALKASTPADATARSNDSAPLHNQNSLIDVSA